MKMRKLGGSGIDVSEISIGCWTFGGGDYWGVQSQEDVNLVVDKSLESGINLFDTAEGYNAGESEISLGKALAGKRDRAVVLTKLNPNSDHEKLNERFEACLKRLGTDYVDILMVHWPSEDHKITEYTLRTFENLQKAGKVRAIGISNYGVSQMAEIKASGVKVCVNELPYNIISRAIEKDILPACIDSNIGVITYSTLQQGILTGKYKTAGEVPFNQAHTRHFQDFRGKGTSRHGEDGAEEELFELLDELQKICDDMNVSMAELTLAWVLHQKGITSTIVGSRNLKQLEYNMKAAELKLDEDLVGKLGSLSNKVLDKLGYSADYYQNRNNSRIK